MEGRVQDGGGRILAPREGEPIRALDELPEGAAHGMEVEQDGRRHGIVVIRRDSAVFAYVNVCPHLGTPLNTFPDRFLDRTGRRLICSTHGALFRVEDGLCIFGPCHTRSLARVPIRVAEGMIVLDGKIPSPPEPQR